MLIPSRGLGFSPYLTISYSDNGNFLLYYFSSSNRVSIFSEFMWTGGKLYPAALYAICERELVWSVAVPWLRQSCYKEYVNQQCNSSFCCAADDEQQIWFQCEGSDNKVSTKQCIRDAANVAKWTCFNGSFTAEAPDTSQCQLNEYHNL